MRRKKGGNCREGFKDVIRVGSEGPTGSNCTIAADAMYGD